MAVAIAFYYSLRLLRAPGVVLTYSACLLPRYVAGLGLLALAPAMGGASDVTAVARVPADLLFHGYLAQLPGDLLMMVVVGFVVLPRRVKRGE